MLFLPRGGRGTKADKGSPSIIEKVNAVLIKANIKATIKSFPQLRLTAPVIFIRVFEAYYWMKIPGMNYSPESVSDHEKNIDLLIHELYKMYGYESLENLTGIDVVSGKQDAIETLLDIFYGVHTVVQDKRPLRNSRPAGRYHTCVERPDDEPENEMTAIFEQVSSLKDLQTRILSNGLFSPLNPDPETENLEQQKSHKSTKKSRPSSAPSGRLLRPTIASGLLLNQNPRPSSPPIMTQRPNSRNSAFGRRADQRPTSPTVKGPPPDPSYFYDSWSGRKAPIEELDKIQERNLKKLLMKRHPEKLEPAPVVPKPKPRQGQMKSEYPGNRIEQSVERYISKMKLQRELPYEGNKKKVSVIEIPSQLNPSLPIYRYLEPYDLLFSIEHCHQCEQHSKVLRHQSVEYHQYALDTFRTLLYSVYSLVMPVRVGIVKFQADLSHHEDQPSRMGAFEVQCAYKDQKNHLQVHLLHSKLTTQKWPSKNVIKKRLLAFISSSNIPTVSRELIPSYSSTATSLSSSLPFLESSLPDGPLGRDGVEPYPIGVLPWHQLKIASEQWDYPPGTVTTSSTTNHILRIFDFRLNSDPSAFPGQTVGTVVSVRHILNTFGYRERYPQLGTITQILRQEKNLKICLKYLESEVIVSAEDCVPLDGGTLGSNLKAASIEYFTVLSSYYTSAQSLFSLNSALSSTSYSTMTPPPSLPLPTKSALNTGRSSIPYVYFILFNLAMYLEPMRSTTPSSASATPLVSNIQWKLLNPNDYSLPRQMDDEEEELDDDETEIERAMMLGSDDFYLTRQSFYCQIYELVWHALTLQMERGDECQFLRINSDLSLSDIMRAGVPLSEAEEDEMEKQERKAGSGLRGEYFDVDLQLCYSEELLDWICARFGNKVNITELIKLARPQPPPLKRRAIVSKSSSNMSTDSPEEEIKNYGKSFSYQLDEEDGDGDGDGLVEGEGDEKTNVMELKKEIQSDPVAGAIVAATAATTPVEVLATTTTSPTTVLMNQLLLLTEEVLEEEKINTENELEKQLVLTSISSIVQDAVMNSTEHQEEMNLSTPPLVPSLSTPALANIHHLTSSLRSRIQQICLRIASPAPNSIEATDAGNYLQTSKYRQGVMKLFHVFRDPNSSPRGGGSGTGSTKGHEDKNTSKDKSEKQRSETEEEIELDMNQFNTALGQFGIACNEEELLILWATLDVDGNTHISPPELLSFLHYQSHTSIGYRQLGEVWNTFQQRSQQLSHEEVDDEDIGTSVDQEPNLLERMEHEMFQLGTSLPPSSTGTGATSLLISATDFFAILKRHGMFSVLKSGDVNILIAYFGVDVSGHPVTDSILSNSATPTPRDAPLGDPTTLTTTTAATPVPVSQQLEWKNYLIRFDDFFSWLQPIDFLKISKRISRFLTALMNHEGGLGGSEPSDSEGVKQKKEEEEKEMIHGIPLRAIDPHRTGYIHRKLFQVFVDQMGLPLTTAEVRSLFRHFGESSDHSLMRYEKLREMLQCSTTGLNHKILPLIGGGSFRKLSVVSHSPPKPRMVGVEGTKESPLKRIESNLGLEEEERKEEDGVNGQGGEGEVRNGDGKDEKGLQEESVSYGDDFDDLQLPRHDSSTLDLPYLTPIESTLSLLPDSFPLKESHPPPSPLPSLDPLATLPVSAPPEPSANSPSSSVSHSLSSEPTQIQIRISMIEFQSTLFDTNPLYDSLIFQIQTSPSAEPHPSHQLQQIRKINLNLEHKHGAGKRFVDELDWDPIDLSSMTEALHLSVSSPDTNTNTTTGHELGQLEFLPMLSLQINPKIAQCLSLSLPITNNTSATITIQIHCRVKDTSVLSSASVSDKRSVRKEVVFMSGGSLRAGAATASGTGGGENVSNQHGGDDNPHEVVEVAEEEDGRPPMNTVKSLSHFDREFDDLYNTLQFTEDGEEDEEDKSNLLIDADLSNNDFLEQFTSPVHPPPPTIALGAATAAAVTTALDLKNDD
jgi:Ca2+-binding EF-hand superfamily protein